ncbi:MAG: NADP-dependent phosphogluconate dehydrogenase [Phycisphaerales bacterium]|nr:NADP-dependent phosphogluconate dehydrogenase [Phycisphaerales bacterium]
MSLNPASPSASTSHNLTGASPPPPPLADIGLVGLAVMGENLALNIADHGFKVAVYNRTTTVTDAFMVRNPPMVFGTSGGSLIPAADVKHFVASIRRPRRVVIMVKAGAPTTAVIDQLAALMEPGDLIVDGGNAEWNDTVRREKALGERGILFVGSGVSGGEEGARFGPSLMPGGKYEAWELLKPVWNAIAAKVDIATGRPLTGEAPGKPVMGGVPCTAYIGPGGAGHYVKMVHNGIEYADMQLICEAYHLLRDVVGLGADELAETFTNWNKGDLDSFLIEITADIFRQKDPVTGKPLVDVVLDAAGQKGTGKWTITTALDLGSPAATIAEAVFARMMSAAKEERTSASKLLSGPKEQLVPATDRAAWIESIREALYCSKVCCYAQGFALMRAASTANDWKLDMGSIAQIWRGGCIIRARFLQKITDAYKTSPDLKNLLLDPYFAQSCRELQPNWRKVVSRAALSGIPSPAFSSALSYYDSYRSAALPSNLLQAQRDYFGAHTYERVDSPRGQFFHLEWSSPGRGQVKV